MPDNIVYNSYTGKYEAMIRGSAWHHKGDMVNDCKDWRETYQRVGFTPVTRHQLEIYGEPIPAWGLFRDDLFPFDKQAAFICETTETREVIQADYMLAYLDAIMESEGAHYESAGVLENGKKLWALVNLHTAFDIAGGGDRWENGLCFTEDRTGKQSARVFITSTRVVCANTFESAVRNSEGKVMVCFRHTQNLQEKLEDALNYFSGAKMNIQLLEEKLRVLSQREVTTEILANIVDKMFPAEDLKQEASVARSKRIKMFLDLYEYNDGNMFPNIRGTAYNLENAKNEMVDHFLPIRRTKDKVNVPDDEIRAERAMFGEGAEYKERILDVILEETKYAPMVPTRSYVDMGGNVVLEKERIPFTMPDNGSVLDAIIDNN